MIVNSTIFLGGKATKDLRNLALRMPKVRLYFWEF
jgi:hypothetical protein